MSPTYGYDLKDGDKILEAPVQMGALLSPLPQLGATLKILDSVRSLALSLPYYQRLTAIFSVALPYFSYEPLARIGGKLSQRIKNEPADFVRNALLACGDHTPNIMVDWYCMQYSHWRRNTCRS